MRNVKALFFGTILFLTAFAGFAHGKNDVDEVQVKNLNSWQEKIDLESKTKKKAQKYNIMITAKDLGGNTAVEGPFNIFIDPESDRPVCGITNPYVDMRVVGNLNIVGTCVDDDAVDRVVLILDEGKVNIDGESIEKTVTAKGKEFWSYYLDTTKLEEGPHTIKVIGYDINGLESHPYILRWQLDRKQPVTEVDNMKMGSLVSGNVSFKGLVSDGNGIKELYYSTDNGKLFIPVKLSEEKDKEHKTVLKNANCSFDFNVDTRKFPDGAAVIWFKAVDESGSVGYYSYLYFIDNTKPEIKVVYPEDGQVLNGKFTVAGYAKDTMGITELKWTFGNKSGEFELVPGNPYWSVTLDTSATKEKSQKLIIHAVDKAGNVVDYSKTINLNPEADKPVATIADPVAGKVFAGDSEPVFVRGLVTDDDNIQKVKVQLDGNEAVEVMTKGAYYYKFCKASELSAGSHKITVTPYDENGVQGNSVTVSFESKGMPATFDGGKMNGSAFVNGMSIHPESSNNFEVTANASLGLKQVRYTIKCGNKELKSDNVELKNAASYKIAYPVSADAPRGMYFVEVFATDSLDRISSYRGFFNVTNTAKIKNSDLSLVFDDSSFVERDGVLEVINNPEFPVSGYVLGGKPTSVEVDPPTRFVKASINGNAILLEALNATGSSPQVKIRVRTDRNGKTLESKPMVFKNDTVIPDFSDVRGNGTSYSNIIDGTKGPVKITGRVNCETGIGKLQYRILHVKADLDAKSGVVAKTSTIMSEDYVKLDASSNFSFTVDPQDWPTGVAVVEIVAESAGGNKNATGLAISTLPSLEGGTPKLFVNWIDGVSLYGVGVYQGQIENGFQVFSRKDMTEGTNVRDMTVTTDGKSANFKSPAVKKDATMDIHFSKLDDLQYASGMSVVCTRGKANEHTLKLVIDSSVAVSGVSYEIYGDKVPGGDEKQTGSAKLNKGENGRVVADIPIGNQPSRVTHIKATVKSALGERVATATLFTIRADNAGTDDVEKVYGFAGSGTEYDQQDGNYVFTSGSKFYFYVNTPTTYNAELISQTEGLSIETEGNIVTLTAQKEGNFRGVRIRATDAYGKVYESGNYNFLNDSEGPNVVIQLPESGSWVRKVISLKGTAEDALGVRNVEYSTDGGETWKKIQITPGRGVTFSRDIDVSTMEDGLIRLCVRAFDNAGHIAYENIAVQKDTVAPEVKVVEPLAQDIINGETLVVFEVKDAGFYNKAEYNGAAGRIDIPVEPLVSTYVGTQEKPLSPRMSFNFTDDAGNATTLNSWQFQIDNKSDLPVAEIHIPDELEVVTRDFTISGVVYDDDGDSKIYYKIDNGEYKQVSDSEVYGRRNAEDQYSLKSSFDISVPISEMTDNEHTVSVYAVDINGVRGEETRRKFRVSLEEPKGSVESPIIDTSVRDIVEIKGVASDKNGIAKVEVSLDNGNSYNDAVGKENWVYKVDTRAIPGGTQVVFIRVTDNYGITGLYSSLINIDNDAPDISLELPLDDSTTTGNLFFSGYAFDNVEITDMYVTIRNMSGGSGAVSKRLKIDRIIGESIDISSLPNGFYNVQLTGQDKAGNKTNVSRNVHLDKSKPMASVNVLYPLNGEHKNGNFNIYGQAEVQPDTAISELKLYVDNREIKSTTITSSGFFKFEIGAPASKETGEVDENGKPIKKLFADLTEGVHTYKVEAVLENGRRVSSPEQTITYKYSGPWITLDNFTYGDFATERPYLKGRAGYILSSEEEAKLAAKDTPKDEKAVYQARKTVQKVEISMDNGKTFTEISDSGKWSYRVENQDLTEGYHFMLVRATMASGERAIERTIVQIDNTSPKIKLISPGRGGRYNQVLDISGLSSDDVELKDVTVSLRKGDKSAYEVPSFIQGLYLDFHVWGATLFDIGAGLTFFDDNVKVQAQWGQFTQAQRDASNEVLGLNESTMRYGGDNVFGLKLLANISSIPFNYFFGHDFDWLFANFAVGAQFTRFNETNSGKPQWLSAVLMQVEFPKVVRQKATMFGTFSFYSEFSLWFIPTDVSGEDIDSQVFQIAFGVRTNVF